MNFSIVFIKVFIWLFFLIGVSFFLNCFWRRLFPGRIRQLIIFPGIIIHEISHALGCFVTGAKIKEISLFSPKGSYVSHSKPVIPLIGNFIISFSPIAGSIFSLAVFFRIFGFSLLLNGLSFDSFYQSFLIIFKESIVFVINNYQFWPFWVFSYLAISLIISLSPSKQDFKNSFLSSAFIVIVLMIFFRFGFFSEQIIVFLENSVIGILGIGVFFGFSAIIITLPIYFIKKLI